MDDFLPARTLTNLADLAVHLNALRVAPPAPLMDISGSYTFNAPPDRVWDLLMDPDVISSCIPGCDALRAGRRGPLSRRAHRGARGDHRHLRRHRRPDRQGAADLVPADRRRPGAAGFVKGNSAITLRADGDDTRSWTSRGTVQTGGAIARVGQRLIGGVSKMMLDRFFACLQGKLAATGLTATGLTVPSPDYARAAAAITARRVNTGIIARR